MEFEINYISPNYNYNNDANYWTGDNKIIKQIVNEFLS